MGYAAWQCESNCFANNPAGDLQLPFGELNIKAEELRYIVCVSKTLLEDSAFDIEGYLFRTVSDAFRDTLNMSIIAGDGVGKPLGIINQNSGVPICQVSPATAPGTFTWQDLLMLKYEVPISLHDGSAYYMNQRTLALLQSMSSAEGRPTFWTVWHQRTRNGTVVCWVADHHQFVAARRRAWHNSGHVRQSAPCLYSCRTAGGDNRARPIYRRLVHALQIFGENWRQHYVQ
jgi:hypothetical protein